MKRKLTRWLRAVYVHLVYFKVTEPGKTLLLGALLSVLLVLAKPSLYVFLVLFAAPVIAYLVNKMMKPRLRMFGEVPSKAIAGSRVCIRLRLTNQSALTCYDVGAGFFGLPRSIREVDRDRFIPRIAPGESAYYHLYLKPFQRGQYEIPLPRYYTTFPFHMFRCGPLSLRSETLTVLPGFAPITLPEVMVRRLYQPGGVAMASKVGESPEYIGNRPFRPGDSPRKIDPRAWARLAAPAVKEYQDEYFSNVAIVLDTYIPTQSFFWRRRFAALEAAVSTTASVADAMTRGECIINLFAAGQKLYRFKTGRHTTHFDSVLEILACVDRCTKSPFDQLASAMSDELQGISLSIFVLLDWDDHRRKLVRMAAEAGGRIRVILIRDRETSRPWQSDQNWVGNFTLLSPAQVEKGEYGLL